MPIITTLRRQIGAVVTLTILGAVTAPPIVAEDADRDQDALFAAETGTTLPEVIVTGGRSTPIGVTGSNLGVPIDDIPASIEILDQETLRQRGDRTNQEAVEKVVGWSGAYSPGNGVVFSTRGFSGNDISILHDGTRISNPTMSSRRFDTFMFERIEVMNGPASVLHGEGAISGAVNYVSKEPNPTDQEYEAVVSYGAFNTAEAAFGAGGPVSKMGKASYRIDGTLGYSDGFIDESSYERYHLNGALRYDVSEDLTLTFRAEGFADDVNSYFGMPLVNGKVDNRLRNKNYNVADNLTEADQVTLRFKIDYRASKNLRLENKFYTVNANRIWRNAEAYSFNSSTNQIQITGLGNVRHEQYLIGDRFQALLTRPLFGHENRFATGFEVSTNHFRRDANFPTVSFNVDAFSPETPSFNTVNSGAALSPGATTVIDTYGFFMEEQFEAWEGLKLVGGFRSDLLNLNVDNHNTGARDRRLFFAPTWRAGVVYNPLPGTTLYAHYTSAENPPSPFVLGRALTFDLEKSREAEIGVRQRLWNDRIELSLALYDLVKQDILTQKVGDANITENIGEQSSQGIEIAIHVEPIDGWRIGGNGSLLSAEFDEFNSNGVSLAGNLPPNVPKQLGNLWTDYRFANGLRIGASLRYVGQRTGNNTNSFGLDSYTTVDAFVAYTFGTMELSIRARNLTDELTLLWAETDFGQQVQVGEPLSVQARVVARF